MIRRLQKGYSPIGVIHSNEEREKTRFCSRCEEMFGVRARLGPRIMPLDETTGKPKSRPSDYELWLECRNCGTVYAKHDTKVEAVIEPLVQTKTNPFDKGKIRSIGQRKKVKRGSNPRLKVTTSRDDIKDEDLKRELKDGAQLVSYSSTDPL
jgi:ribosomal protein S27AE